MKLSIITPYYKTLDDTLKLANSLVPQLNDEVEWIIVDDGCAERKLDKIKAKVVHLGYNSGNASIPRNLGLFYAKGDYIAFIDSDDNVTSNYVEKILKKIDEGFDYCYISWKTDDGRKFIIEDRPPVWNTAVWNCIFNKKYIGETRFPPNINIGEDKYFSEKLFKDNPNAIKKNITDILYIYKIRPGSLTDRCKKGILKTTKNS